MKSIITNTLLGFVSLFLLSENSNAQQLAFPGAEGFGRFATGGRGGSIYHVTNLDDSGEGSFRDAVSQSNRTVVFDVGGVINITDRIVIHSNVTVAGQTAPGGGITVYGNGIALNGSSGNSIIRYIRFRMGENGDYRKDALGISDGQDYIFDHVSISWGWDGTVDVNGTNIDNITFQDCIVGQGIDIVQHSTGGLVQSGKWSMIRSLYIDNETRNPKGKGTHEFINNVIYNWGSDGYIMGATDAVSAVNCVGNWFIYGPSSSSNTHITRTTTAFEVYAADNWVDNNKNGILDGFLMTDYKTATLMDAPYDYDGMKYVMSADSALAHVIEHVGGSFPARDAVDELLIDQLISYGKKGKIIERESDNGIDGNIGTVANGTPPTDTDQDGMPDTWETDNGMDPNVASNNNDTDGDGYTDIEEYLDWLVNEAPYIPAELTKYGAGSSTQTVDINKAIDDFYYIWKNAVTVKVTGLPLGVSYEINSDEQKVTISGSPKVTGSYDFSVSAIGGGIDSTLYGTITVNADGLINLIAIQENETGFCFCDGTIDNNNEGFTGDGFANTANTIDTGITWKVYVPEEGVYDFTWQYANGSSIDRAADILVNDTVVVENFSMDTTDNWTTWISSAIQPLNLRAGDNTVRLQSITSSGLANIDYMLISGKNPIAGNCNGSTVNTTVVKQNISVEISPNPVTGDNFIVTIPENDFTSDLTIRIFDMQGRLAFSQKYVTAEEILVNTNLNTGSYILQVAGSKSSSFKKLIVR